MLENSCFKGQTLKISVPGNHIPEQHEVTLADQYTKILTIDFTIVRPKTQTKSLLFEVHWLS